MLCVGTSGTDSSIPEFPSLTFVHSFASFIPSSTAPHLTTRCFILIDWLRRYFSQRNNLPERDGSTACREAAAIQHCAMLPVLTAQCEQLFEWQSVTSTVQLLSWEPYSSSASQKVFENFSFANFVFIAIFIRAPITCILSQKTPLLRLST